MRAGGQDATISDRRRLAGASGPAEMPRSETNAAPLDRCPPIGHSSVTLGCSEFVPDAKNGNVIWAKVEQLK